MFLRRGINHKWFNLRLKIFFIKFAFTSFRLRVDKSHLLVITFLWCIVDIVRYILNNFITSFVGINLIPKLLWISLLNFYKFSFFRSCRCWNTINVCYGYFKLWHQSKRIWTKWVWIFKLFKILRENLMIIYFFFFLGFWFILWGVYVFCFGKLHF